MKGPPLQDCIFCVTSAFSRAILPFGQKSSLLSHTTSPKAGRLPPKAISSSSTTPTATTAQQNAPGGPGFSRTYFGPTWTPAIGAADRCDGSKSLRTTMPLRACLPSMASAHALPLPLAAPCSVNSSCLSGAEATSDSLTLTPNAEAPAFFRHGAGRPPVCLVLADLGLGQGNSRREPRFRLGTN
jgi:hypothetical protein